MADIFSSQSGKIIFKSPLGALQIEVDVDGNVSVRGDLVVRGNLTVQGTGTAKDQTSLTVEDALIVANFGEDSFTPDELEEGRGFMVDRGAFSRIDVDDPDNPGTPMNIVQRQDANGVIQIDGSGDPIWRDDPLNSYHGQYLPGNPPSTANLTPTPVDDLPMPRGLIWHEGESLWDLTWNYPARTDPNNNALPKLSRPEETNIKGIATPDNPELINLDYAASIGYANDRANDVQADLDDLKNDYLDVGGAKNADDIMYWGGSKWEFGELEISKDKSPQLGADLDVGTYSITGNDINIVAGSATIALDTTNGNIRLHGIAYPKDGNTQGYVLAANASGDVEFVNVSALPGTGIQSVFDDKSPQLGGDLDVNIKSIVSSSGNIVLDPSTNVVIGNEGVIASNTNLVLQPADDLVLNGITWPVLDGNDGDALLTDGNGTARWSEIKQYGVEDITTGDGLSNVDTQIGESKTVALAVNVGNGIQIDSDASDAVAIKLDSDSGLLVGTDGLANNFTTTGGTNGTSVTVARGNHFHANATAIIDGYMPKADKAKIDAMQAGAELNTASNLGTGEGVYAGKVASDLQFKSITAGANIVLSSNGNEITISATDSPDDLVQSVTGGDGISNVGSNIVGDVELAVDSSVVRTSRTIATGNGLTGGGNLTINRTLSVGQGDGIIVSADTVSHADTSTQASSDNSGGIVIQDITLDTYGHITGLGTVDLDGRYFTETEADSRYVNITGDTLTGTLTGPGFNTNSAMKYKECILPFEDALAKVLTIDVFTYQAKDDLYKERRLGVSAESMAKVAPELVAFKNGEPDAVNYAQGFALLTQAIQEQEQRRLINKIKRVVSRVTAFFKKENK